MSEAGIWTVATNFPGSYILLGQFLFLYTFSHPDFSDRHTTDADASCLCHIFRATNGSLNHIRFNPHLVKVQLGFQMATRQPRCVECLPCGTHNPLENTFFPDCSRLWRDVLCKGSLKPVFPGSPAAFRNSILSYTISNRVSADSSRDAIFCFRQIAGVLYWKRTLFLWFDN